MSPGTLCKADEVRLAAPIKFQNKERHFLGLNVTTTYDEIYYFSILTWMFFYCGITALNPHSVLPPSWDTAALQGAALHSLAKAALHPGDGSCPGNTVVFRRAAISQ